MSIESFVRRMLHTSGQLDATVPYITMFDDITVSVLPTGGSYAYAGYVDGIWPTFPELKAKFPRNRLISIAVFASDNADFLDIENGDASIKDAPGWFERQRARGVWKPGFYIQASNMKALEQELAAAHIDRSSYRLWVAHYGKAAHLCSPKTCGYGISTADGTQWTNVALGLSLDQSILVESFFDGRPAPSPTPAPVPVTPSWLEAIMNDLPTLKEGDNDGPGKVEYTGRMQALIKYIGQVNKIEAASSLTVDGQFGIKTANALLAIQSFFGLTTDRICGPQTWACLVTGHK